MMNQSDERNKCELNFRNSQENSAEDFFYRRNSGAQSSCDGVKPFSPIPRNETERIKKGKSFKSVFLKRSSVYALNQIGNSTSTARRMFWMFVLLVGIAGFSWQVLQFLASYYTYPVVVNVYSTRTQDFPAVTICNINSFRKKFQSCVIDKEIDYDKCPLYTSMDDVDYNKGSDKGSDKGSPRKGAAGIENISREEFLKRYNKKTCEIGDTDIRATKDTDFPATWRKVLEFMKYKNIERYGHQKQRLIRRSTFYSDKLHYSNFSRSVSFPYGNCYTFTKWGGHELSSETGPDSGLNLNLDIELNQYHPLTGDAGVRIQIHDSYQPHDIVAHGINLPPGFKTFIAVSKFITARLPAPYPDKCRDYEIGDSESQCVGRCKDIPIMSNCSCSLSHNRYPDIDRCDYNRGFVACCLRDLKPRFACDCPPACKEVGYNLQISSTVWPSKGYFEYWKKPNQNVSIEGVRETRLLVQVYYDTLDCTVTKQEPMYHDSEFWSLVGGQLGLWLGLSLITIIEFLENFCIMCKH